MRFMIWFAVLAFAPICGISEDRQQESQLPAWENELCQIDGAIEKFTNLRDLELGKAARYQDLGDRLQFNTSLLMDARRYWQKAETSREIAARYQKEIDKLEVERGELLQKHGITDPNYKRNSVSPSR